MEKMQHCAHAGLDVPALFVFAWFHGFALCNPGGPESADHFGSFCQAEVIRDPQTILWGGGGFYGTPRIIDPRTTTLCVARSRHLHIRIEAIKAPLSLFGWYRRTACDMCKRVETKGETPRRTHHTQGHSLFCAHACCVADSCPKLGFVVAEVGTGPADVDVICAIKNRYATGGHMGLKWRRAHFGPNQCLLGLVIILKNMPHKQCV